jgi:hypothetical protein
MAQRNQATLKPADNFADAYRAFQMELTDSELLNAYYVERADRPAQKLKTMLALSEPRSQILYSGQTRSGKTTELHYLADDVKDQYYVVFLSVFRDFQPADVTTIDLLLLSATHLCDQALGDSVPISEDLQRLLSDWLLQNSSETFQTKVAEKTKGFALGAKLKYLVAELGGTYSVDSTLRTESRTRLKPRVAELAEKIGLLAEQIRQRRNRDPLIIIDDLEKVSIETQEALFFKNAPDLANLDCRIIYTINRAMYYKPEGKAIRDFFRNCVEIPYVRIATRQPGEHKEGLDLLRRLLLRRMEAKLIAEDAREKLIRCSNGVLGDLMAVAAGCCLEAYERGAGQITWQMVDRSAQTLTNNFQRMLLKDDYPLLTRIRDSKRAEPDDRLSRLMFAQAALEYEDEAGIYYDVHPAVLPLLKTPLAP